MPIDLFLSAATLRGVEGMFALSDMILLTIKSFMLQTVPRVNIRHLRKWKRLLNLTGRQQVVTGRSIGNVPIGGVSTKWLLLLP